MHHICVYAPTERELQHAEEHLRRAGPLTVVAKPSSSSTASEGPSPPYTLTFHSSETNSAPCGTFDASRYFSSSLETNILGRTLFTAATTASTQALIQENITKLPNGVLFVADRQVGGKGRGGNVWESPPGCLMFSVASHLSVSGQRLPFVQYLVTLAVVQAVQYEAVRIIKESLGSLSEHQLSSRPLDIGIKWPNDIYTRGSGGGSLKLGGVLCHSSYRNGQFHVIMGVGLNVANRQPTTCVDALIQQAAKTAAGEGEGAAPPPPLPIERERLLASVMTALEPMLDRLSEEGFSPFEADYYSAWLHSEQQVLLEEESSAGGGGEVQHVAVTIKGLSPHGYLLAVGNVDGQTYELHPDGNSFDFFKGLVGKKLPNS